ncbi:MAG: hypothetical protein HQK95_06485 [Nitrospirae bacterium]|nr:hypothetical protein [Nitrospirota bacterium]
MSHKIKNLMTGGSSRLEKRTSKKKKGKAVKEYITPLEKSEVQPLNQNLSEEKIPEIQLPDTRTPPDTSHADIAPDDLPPHVRESLRILLNNNITLECMQAIESMSSKNKDFMESFIKLGPQAMVVFCNIAGDEDYVITSKIKLISLLNRVSRNEIVHKLLRRVGAAIEALRRLRDLLLLQ